MLVGILQTSQQEDNKQKLKEGKKKVKSLNIKKPQR